MFFYLPRHTFWNSIKEKSKTGIFTSPALELELNECP